MSLNNQETFNESSDGEYLNESDFGDYYKRLGPTMFDSSVFRIILYCILSLGVLGNFTTIIYITYNKHLHTPTFITICSMAITDLTVVIYHCLLEFMTMISFLKVTCYSLHY